MVELARWRGGLSFVIESSFCGFNALIIYEALILMYYKCQVIVVPFELKIVLVIFKTQRNCYYGYKYETLFSLILFFNT